MTSDQKEALLRALTEKDATCEIVVRAPSLNGASFHTIVPANLMAGFVMVDVAAEG